MKRLLSDPLFQGGCMGLGLVLACCLGLSLGEMLRGEPVSIVAGVAR